MRKRIFSFFIFTLLAVPLPTFAAEIDASADALTFSQSDFFAGDHIRVYGALSNKGSQDIHGLVEFFQGINQIGEPRPFSVKAFGPTAYAWVDWKPTEGTYNVSMKIMSTEPIDQYLANNTAISGLMTIAKRLPPPPPPAPTPAPAPVQPLILPQEQPTKPFPKVEPQTAPTQAKATVGNQKKIMKQSGSTLTSPTSLSAKALATAETDKQKELAPLADELKTIIQESLAPARVETIEQEIPTIAQDTEDTIQKNSSTKILYLLGVLAALSMAVGSYFFYLSRKE